MEIKRSITELIQIRSSWRSFKPIPIEVEKKERLISFMDSLDAPPFGSRARFALIPAVLSKNDRAPGTYGIIRGAHEFLVGAVQSGRMDLEDFGYQFEKIILCATDLGLGTCWMGGTFERTRFAERIGLKPSEFLPAVSPVGYRADKRSLIDSAFRLGAASRKRKPWKELFYEKDFTEHLSPLQAGKFRNVLEMVRMAPSASNKQPWRIIKHDDTFHFFLARSHGLNKIFSMDLQRIDMGIAMAHFELALAEQGLNGKWLDADATAPFLPERIEYIVSYQTSG